MDWVEQVRSLNVDVASGRRAPYKQLLLLWMIGRVKGGELARISFRDAEEPLKELMNRFSLGKQAEPKLPFVHLAANPELWTVEDSNGSNVYEMDKTQRRKIGFMRGEVVGELSTAFVVALDEPKMLESVVTALLHTDFPETTHQGILDEVNLSGRVLPNRQAEIRISGKRSCWPTSSDVPSAATTEESTIDQLASKPLT